MLKGKTIYFAVTILIVLIAASLFIFTYLQNDNKEIKAPVLPTSRILATPTSSPTPWPTPENTATYQVTFESNWSKETNPKDFPTDAHFSPMFVFNHDMSEEAELYKEGTKSSAGIKQMAETGKTVALEKEAKQLINDAWAFTYTVGKRFDAPGKDQVNIEVSSDYRFLTVVSMIAPSPDWFIAIQDVALVNEGLWVEELTLPVNSLDAGTDSGSTFTSADKPTSPQGVVKPIDSLGDFGTITIKRIK